MKIRVCDDILGTASVSVTDIEEAFGAEGEHDVATIEETDMPCHISSLLERKKSVQNGT